MSVFKTENNPVSGIYFALYGADAPSTPNKMWEGHRIILSEHEEYLWQERRKRDEFQPPALDEDALQEINRRIEESMEEGKPIVVTYATMYEPRYFCGFVAKVDLVTHRIKMVNGDEIEWIPFGKVLAADEPPEDE